MSLEISLRETKRGQRWLARGTEPGDLKATPRLPCVAVITQCRRQPNMISIRCKCMAGTWRTPSDRYFNFDRIAVVASLAEAKAVYDKHRREKL